MSEIPNCFAIPESRILRIFRLHDAPKVVNILHSQNVTWQLHVDLHLLRWIWDIVHRILTGDNTIQLSAQTYTDNWHISGPHPSTMYEDVTCCYRSVVIIIIIVSVPMWHHWNTVTNPPCITEWDQSMQAAATAVAALLPSYLLASARWVETVTVSCQSDVKVLYVTNMARLSIDDNV